LFITAAYGLLCDCGKLERKPHFCRRAGTICDIIDSIQIEERGMF
jgi:hypothetical protein